MFASSNPLLLPDLLVESVLFTTQVFECLLAGRSVGERKVSGDRTEESKSWLAFMTTIEVPQKKKGEMSNAAAPTFASKVCSLSGLETWSAHQILICNLTAN